jgi:hypothetical protein
VLLPPLYENPDPVLGLKCSYSRTFRMECTSISIFPLEADSRTPVYMHQDFLGRMGLTNSMGWKRDALRKQETPSSGGAPEKFALRVTEYSKRAAGRTRPCLSFIKDGGRRWTTCRAHWCERGGVSISMVRPAISSERASKTLWAIDILMVTQPLQNSRQHGSALKR